MFATADADWTNAFRSTPVHSVETVTSSAIPLHCARIRNPPPASVGRTHSTRFHPCPAPDCNGGGRCLHSLTHCVNSSINPQCPTRAKVRLQQQNSGITSSTIRQFKYTNNLQTTMTRCSHEYTRNEAEDPDVGPIGSLELDLDF